MSDQGKFWCFTDFNCFTDYSFLGASYVCYGREICPTTNKIHHQGYCEFKTNKRFNSLKKLNPNIHWEKRLGTQEQAINYCKGDCEGKTHNPYFYEFGEKQVSKQGKRTDIDNVKTLISEGKGMSDIVEVATSFQSLRFAETLLKYKEKKRDWLTEVFWFWGPTGTGKTKTAWEESEGKAWISLKNLKWWEGYDAHEYVIFDDFRGDFCTFHELLRILDRYPYTIEVKGGSRQLLAKKIWITSPFHWSEVYKDRTDEDLEQLGRRITSERYFNSTAKASGGEASGGEVFVGQIF